MREFKTGATRDNDTEKIDPEGFLNPEVIKVYCEYMHHHRKQADGKLRDSDNWQRGMSKSVYMKSLWRHFLDLWLEHRGYKSREGIILSLFGILFNTMGYLLEDIKEENEI